MIYNMCLKTLALLLAPALALAQSCSIQNNIDLTFYDVSSNGGSALVAYNCDGRNNIAQGSGTHDDPLTFASAPGEYNECEVIYLPYLRKYLRMEETCQDCGMRKVCC